MAASAIGWWAPSSVARAGGEVDGGLGDRLVGLLLGGERSLGLLALLVGEVRERVLALADDVDLEVGAGDLGADAGRVGLLVALVLVAGGGGRGLGGRSLGGRS